MKFPRLAGIALAVAVPAAGAYDYPTSERVYYVLDCMQKLGGESMENLAVCSCRIDHIAERISYEDYDAGVLYERYQPMPGEKGAMFREGAMPRQAKGALHQAAEQAEHDCPAVRRVTRKAP
ncbi:MAG: hypothetical protein AB7Q97_02640 [Gammaproteobacteria bacterium]